MNDITQKRLSNVVETYRPLVKEGKHLSLFSYQCLILLTCYESFVDNPQIAVKLEEELATLYFYQDQEEIGHHYIVKRKAKEKRE